MTFTEKMEAATEAVRTLQALAAKISRQLTSGGVTTDIIHIELTREETVLVIAALEHLVEGL